MENEQNDSPKSRSDRSLPAVQDLVLELYKTIDEFFVQHETSYGFKLDKRDYIVISINATIEVAAFRAAVLAANTRDLPTMTSHAAAQITQYMRDFYEAHINNAN